MYVYVCMYVCVRMYVCMYCILYLLNTDDINYTNLYHQDLNFMYVCMYVCMYVLYEVNIIWTLKSCISEPGGGDYVEFYLNGKREGWEWCVIIHTFIHT